jgi:hypothetical protein
MPIFKNPTLPIYYFKKFYINKKMLTLSKIISSIC